MKNWMLVIDFFRTLPEQGGFEEFEQALLIKHMAFTAQKDSHPPWLALKFRLDSYTISWSCMIPAAEDCAGADERKVEWRNLWFAHSRILGGPDVEKIWGTRDGLKNGEVSWGTSSGNLFSESHGQGFHVSINSP